MFRNLYLYLLCSTIFLDCTHKKGLFEQVPGTSTGILFNNTIQENDSINVLDYENVYNGGGVGIGDFNNDGLSDIYFTGNLVSNKLYLNKGNFKFEDITDIAAVGGAGRWCRGVAVVDINNDGWQDMYVCTSIKKDAAQRKNLLYVNQGLKNGVPVFKEMAAEYGLDDTTYSTMADFFDYDNDGDLDVFIAVNEIIHGDYPNKFRPRMLHGEHPSTGRLYKNEWNDSLKHPVFTNVSKEAGITIEGYSHGVAVADINQDGWKDIYISNDYLSNNILYINNGDGTFTDKVTSYFKHTAANAMGNDVVDLNNDGRPDVVEMDMNPEDNYRKKMMLNANSYQTYQNSDYFGYQYQYVRNVVQLNDGPRFLNNDSVGDPVFSEIGFFSGVSETDWSWTPLVADFDNDGWRDMIITNGFPKDVTDHDFIAFRNESFSIASKKQLLEQIPAVKIHNYAFRNRGDMHFENVSADWGLTEPTFSNGAAYVDLDNDGDLDVVINNINDPASVYKNVNSNKKSIANYLNIRLLGEGLNKNGFGAWVELHDGKQLQVYEHTPYRGYLSSVQADPHFGVGASARIDSVIIKWPGGKMQVIKNVPVNQTLIVSASDAHEQYSWQVKSKTAAPLFTEISREVGDTFQQKETDFVDFNIQKLLPHKFSENGPALASGDLTGDGLDDMVIGGSFSHSATIMVQQKNGTFTEKELIPGATLATKRWEDLGILLFDADGDKDLDIYIASGGYENESQSEPYADKLYINDGRGNFTINDAALPLNKNSKSCVRAADYDKDGDLDVFVAGRVDPWKYPNPVSSSIYRNDSKNGVIKFTDVTSTVAPTLGKVGLVCDAIFTDFNNDGWQDLILCGEWMPITFLKNNHGVFQDATTTSGISKQLGWWTSLLPGDFDNDGDIDYIAGNLGLNSFYRASDKEPVHLYAKDFDNNGNLDAIPTLYLPASQQDLEKKEFAAHTRDDLTKQMIGFKSKFQNYNSYAAATFSQMFSPEELKGARVLTANWLANSYIKNNGDGTFQVSPLPPSVQYTCMNGMLAEDFDGDGNLDVLITGNDYSTEVSVGRYDAGNGLYLKGNGKGGFLPVTIQQSGWFVPGNSKALVKLQGTNNRELLASAANRGPLKIFRVNKNRPSILLEPDDESGMIQFKNGSMQKCEFSYGASYLSQSSRSLNFDSNMRSVKIIKSHGGTRTVAF